MEELKPYFLYVHSSEESAYEAARDAGYTPEEIAEHQLTYAGYEIKIKVTPIKDGLYKEEIA